MNMAQRPGLQATYEQLGGIALQGLFAPGHVADAWQVLHTALTQYK
jgi:hypothetical protein